MIGAPGGGAGLALLALAAGLPLLFSPDGAAAFSTAKRDGFGIVAAWMLAAVGAGGLAAASRDLRLIPLTWPALAVMTQAAALVAMPGPDFAGGWRDGAGTLLAVLGPMTGLVAATSPDPRFPRKFATAFSAGATVAGMYGLAQFAGLGASGWDRSYAGGAPASTLGNPLFLGSVLAAGVPLALSGWLGATPGRGGAWGVSLMIMSIALLASQARGAGAGALVALGLLGCDPTFRGAATSRTGRRRLAGWILIVGGVAVAWSVPGRHNPSGARLSEHVVGVVRPGQWIGRIMIWEATAGTIRRSPIGGAGVGAIRHEFPAAQSRLLAEPRYGGLAYRTTGHSHQDWLQWAAERGLVGLGLLWWMLIASLGAAWRSPDPVRRVTGCALAAWGVDACVNGPLHVAPTAQLVWVFLGVAGGRTGTRRAREAGTGRGVILGMAVALLIARPFVRDLAGDRYLGRGLRMIGPEARQEALRHLFAADALLLEDRRVHLHAGSIHYGAGRFEEAARSYALDVERNPALASGWHNLGLALRSAGRLREAQAAFRRALTLNPRDPESRRLAGAGAGRGSGGAEKRW